MKKILVNFFDADVSFSAGYNFFSISNLKIENNIGRLTCKYVSVNLFDRKLLIFSQVETNFDYEVIRKAFNIIQRAIIHKDSGLSFFYNWSVIINGMTIKGERKLEITKAAFKLSSSKFDFQIENFNYEDEQLFLKIPKLSQAFHYFGHIPKLISFLRPKVEVIINKNVIQAKVYSLKAYSQKSPIWRFTSDECDAEITFRQKETIGTSTNTSITFSFPLNLNISLVESNFIMTIPCLLGTSGNSILDMKITALELKTGIISAKTFDVTIHTSILPMIIHPILFDNTKFSFEDFNVKAELNQNSFFKIISKNYEQCQRTFKSTKTQLEFDLSHSRPLFVEVEDINLDMHQLIQMNTFHLKYAFLTDIMEVLKLINNSSYFSNNYKIITKKGTVENVSILNATSISDATINVNKKPNATIERSRNMVDSIFPGAINISHVVGVQEYSITCKAGELVSSTIDVADFEIEGMVYLLLLAGEIKQLEFCGMIDIIAKSAHVSMKNVQIPPLWMISMDIGEAGILLGKEAITAYNVIGDLTDFKFETISTSQGIVGKIGNVIPQKDGRAKISLEELNNNGFVLKVVNLFFQNQKPTKISAEEVTFGNCVARDYRYDFIRNEMKSSFVNLDLDHMKVDFASSYFSYASIDQLNVGNYSLTSVEIVVSTSFKINAKSFSCISRPGLTINAENIGVDVTDVIDITSTNVDVQLWMKFDFHQIFNLIQGKSICLNLDKISIKFTDGRMPVNLAELKRFIFSFTNTKSENNFTTCGRFTAESFDFYDIIVEPRLIMYISPCENCISFLISISNYKTIEKCSLKIVDCYINSKKDDIARMSSVFSPIIPELSNSPPIFSEILSIEELDIGGFPLSLSYLDNTSYLFGSERIFQFAMPPMIINKRTMSFGGLIYYVLMERKRQIVSMTENTIQKESDNKDQNNSSGKNKSGGKK
ncbi:hypothetical protein TVAG_140410 [Trichomonas vaginalis G3]|uniref:Uncharacterized protein n=1 Tax=Trichomonas vaginalis (strain ATCC PRA-98 / G3) TaxID=412133 RepID=A2EJS9_TRIV3|nr:hypothetical protein TVAGG3_0409600 [Trichomonas vaginalis G3]EAY07067.1 hypothetical protein TVAG_140410 [Trichomonas vaginalis G3]KAI5535259.1 hypothetical protein TVAGG3_0409600 [Trichomonas vaginalis G3]|eukprot:XP_001319290.1 hypothetical protein [Trichomonas vaginalis G3]